MPLYEREDKILSVLMEKDHMSLQELSAILYVSVPTLRRDMTKLEQMGKVIRTHGGVQIVKKAADEQIPFFRREQEQYSAKYIMAKKAVEFIEPGNTVMLDGSTSAYNIVPLLADIPKLVVITSSAKSSMLLGQMGITNICTGGRMITESLSYYGEDAERTVRSYNADIVFFSCRGLSMDGKLTDNSYRENNLRRAMLAQAQKRIFLCDSSKIGKTYLNNLCCLPDVDEIISEADLPDSLIRMTRKNKG